MDTFSLDLRYAARALRPTPYVTVAAVLSIGLGVGAAASVFSWMDATVLHPFPAVADEGRLLGIEVGPPNGGMGAWSYQTFKEHGAGFHIAAGLALWAARPDVSVRVDDALVAECGRGAGAPNVGRREPRIARTQRVMHCAICDGRLGNAELKTPFKRIR